MALRNFRVGDKVKAIILSVDNEKRRISLGLKPSYFSDIDMSYIEEESESEATPVDGSGLIEDEEDDDENAIEVDTIEAGDESDEESAVDADDVVFNASGSVENTSEGYEDIKRPAMTSVFSLNGFHWDKDADNEESEASSSSSDESDSETEKRARKRKKQIEHDLTADMQTRMPESVADFERHLLASPNSSYLWLQYMSFQLQLAEIDKAREVGKRALEAINIREEQEKLNVWIGLLNLENTYGTEESLDSLFKDAARHNDSKTVHLRMADIYEQSDKLEVCSRPLLYHMWTLTILLQKAEEQYKRTYKKFGYSAKAWTLFGEFYMRHGKLEEARKLLPRSLQSLEKRKRMHLTRFLYSAILTSRLDLKVISKFAQLEYKHGEAERGKTIFEGIIDSHKKRWDLWSIYMDMEAGQKDIASVRCVFWLSSSASFSKRPAEIYLNEYSPTR